MAKKYIILFTLLLSITAQSQSGELDTTFGTNGKVVTGFGSNQNAANAIAIQPDGKFLVGGTCINNTGKNDFALARYNSDGSLDLTFGINGKAITNFQELNSVYNYINSIYVLPNGNIVVCGIVGPGGGQASTAAIVRYQADGTIDTGFGNNGKIITELGYSGQYGTKIIFLADGSFIFTSSKALGNNLTAIGVEKYTETGSLDLSFGTDGKVQTSFGPGSSAPASIALKPDGKFVIAGGYSATNSGIIAVAQYNPDGTLDTGFDLDGKVTTSFGPGTGGYAIDISVNPAGKVKVAGFVGNTITNFALAQYNLDGSLDVSFDGDGKVLTPLPLLEEVHPFINSIAIQSDGKYLLVLGSYSNTLDTRRYNSDGSTDTAFGVDGRVSTIIADGFNEAQAAAVLPDGKIIVVGKSQPSDLESTDFAIARYDSSGTLDPSLDGDGKLTTSFENADDLANHLLVQPNDKLITVGTSATVQQNTLVSKNVVLSGYNSNGSLDTTFGNAGKVISAFGQIINIVSFAALQTDGKILLGISYTDTSEPGNLYELIRYNTDGSLDNSFGTVGKAAIDFYPYSVAFQADGKIVVAAENLSGFLLARYSSNGILDPTFGTNGQRTVSFGQTFFSGKATVMIQPDQKIIFSGGAYTVELGISTFATARFLPDGSVDTSFGENGQVQTVMGSTCYPLTGTILPDGKIVVAGTSDGSNFSTVRYQSNGTIDPNYGTAGITTTSLYIATYYGITSIRPQPDGKFLVGLTQAGQNPSTNDFKIKRINPDGTYDDSFGGQDGITTDFHNTYDAAFVVALQSDDKIVVAGGTHSSTSIDFGLTRYSNTILAADNFNQDFTGLVLYPNPVKEVLIIKSLGTEEYSLIDYSIYNMMGQMVYRSADANLETDTSSFSSGIYTVVFTTDRGRVSKKFVKQ